MQEQPKRDPNLYTPPHAPQEAQNQRSGMPQVVNTKNKRNRKVVITIKQQAADGTMVPAMIPAGALNQVSAAAAANTGAVSG